MGYSIGFDANTQRDVGYGVPAICDHPDCNAEIDRGMGYACGGGLPGDACGRYFCTEHGGGSDCPHTDDAPPLKPEHPEWIAHKLTCPSWRAWREEHPEWVAAQGN